MTFQIGNFFKKLLLNSYVKCKTFSYLSRTFDITSAAKVDHQAFSTAMFSVISKIGKTFGKICVNKKAVNRAKTYIPQRYHVILQT